MSHQRLGIIAPPVSYACPFRSHACTQGLPPLLSLGRRNALKYHYPLCVLLRARVPPLGLTVHGALRRHVTQLPCRHLGDVCYVAQPLGSHKFCAQNIVYSIFKVQFFYFYDRRKYFLLYTYRKKSQIRTLNQKLFFKYCSIETKPRSMDVLIAFSVTPSALAISVLLMPKK